MTIKEAVNKLRGARVLLGEVRDTFDEHWYQDLDSFVDNIGKLEDTIEDSSTAHKHTPSVKTRTNLISPLNPNECIAECSCGWQADGWWLSYQPAMNEAKRHANESTT